MTFAEFAAFTATYPLDSLDATYVPHDEDGRKLKIRGRFEHAALDRIPRYDPDYSDYWSEQHFFGNLVKFLHPYSILRLLGDVDANKDAPVVWQYGPLVQNGWASEREFEPNARRNETFLIATEGSSDIHILRRALALLRSDIADFFRFIDVSDSHPFSGTGSLVKFAEGLAKIDVHNQVLFMFDNDAEGHDAHQRMSSLALPVNMRGVMLPELEEFRSFPTQGPEGIHHSDINRRAAAIECYLDLEVSGYPPPRVRWTNYKKNLDVYHGVLEYKEAYAREFLKQTPETLTHGAYDVRKIETALDSLVAECVMIALDQWDEADIELRYEL